ncbi:MAG: hypothetical protein ABI992_12240 [Chthoniobacterales bacterium]
MAALLAFGAIFIYFGWRGTLDAFMLRMSDLNPVYWYFHWRYRGQPAFLADRAFLRFFWRMWSVLWVATAIRTLVDAVLVVFRLISRPA